MVETINSIIASDWFWYGLVTVAVTVFIFFIRKWAFAKSYELIIVKIINFIENVIPDNSENKKVAKTDKFLKDFVDKYEEITGAQIEDVSVTDIINNKESAETNKEDSNDN